MDIFNIKTISETDEITVPSDESDSQDELDPVSRKKIFSRGFEFTTKTTLETGLAVLTSGQRFLTTLDEKIDIVRRKSAIDARNEDSEYISSDVLKPKIKKGKGGSIKPIESEDVLPNDDELFLEDCLELDHSTSFQDMKLSRPVLKAITSLNYSQPTPIQSACIPLALQGKDICACAVTGSGKTAAFMIPIVERLLFRPSRVPVTRVLVLVPTRELGLQVYTVSRQLAHFTNVELSLAIGGLDIKTQEAALRISPDILIATPGRLIDHLHNTPSFGLTSVEILVIDEADRCLDEYFSEQLQEIVKLCSYERQTMLFSATMTDAVQDLVSLSLKNPLKVFVNRNTEVSHNLTQEFVRIRTNKESDREAILCSLCCRTFVDRTIVFVQTKKCARRLHVLLGLFGIKVCQLHGNLSQPQRMEALKKFKDGEVDLLIATDLAARGLDIVNVRTVINFMLPPTLSHYVHRVGRTARAGKAGRAVSLVGESERRLLKDVIKTANGKLKTRMIPQDVLSEYKNKVFAYEKEVNRILLEDDLEKEDRAAELKIKKAEKIIEHHEEIYGRPKRNWFQSHRERMENNLKRRLEPIEMRKKAKKGDLPKNQAVERVKKDLAKAQLLAARVAKRHARPQRTRAFNDGRLETTKKGVQSKKGKSSFSHDLANTSQRSVKMLRSEVVSEFKVKRRPGAKVTAGDRKKSGPGRQNPQFGNKRGPVKPKFRGGGKKRSR